MLQFKDEIQIYIIFKKIKHNRLFIVVGPSFNKFYLNANLLDHGVPEGFGPHGQQYTRLDAAHEDGHGSREVLAGVVAGVDGLDPGFPQQRPVRVHKGLKQISG